MKAKCRNSLALRSALLPFIAALSLILTSPIASAGFPLSTEDTGTMGLGRAKIEITSERNEEEVAGSQSVSAANEIAIIYGLKESLNVLLALPYKIESAQDAGGNSSQVQGVGDIKFAIKWRYFEQDTLSLALKAVVTTPSSEDKEQLGAGKSTQSIDAVVGYQMESWEFSFNAGYKLNNNTRNQREALGRLSAAVEHSMAERWKVMADIGAASNTSMNAKDFPTFVGAGLSYSLLKDVSLDAGVKRRFTEAATDITWIAGMNMRF